MSVSSRVVFICVLNVVTFSVFFSNRASPMGGSSPLFVVHMVILGLREPPPHGITEPVDLWCRVYSLAECWYTRGPDIVPVLCRRLTGWPIPALHRDSTVERVFLLFPSCFSCIRGIDDVPFHLSLSSSCLDRICYAMSSSLLSSLFLRRLCDTDVVAVVVCVIL